MTDYLQYVQNTEPPVIFHRWSFLSIIGALLERNIWYGNNYFTFYPNLYVMLVGDSGTKKNTAINIAKKVLEQTDYNYFSVDRTSKEKYLEDLSKQHEEVNDDITTATIFGSNSSAFNGRNTPSFIVAPEFNNFIGNGNIEFMSLLGDLWDWNGKPYANRFKNGKEILVPNPTISLLGGNTATGFSLAFPAAAIGQGFFSRLILIHSTPTGRKIRTPFFPDWHPELELREIQRRMHGLVIGNGLAELMLDSIYNEWEPLEDNRFVAYSTRRYSQLIKLCLILAACDLATEIHEKHVLLANTILTHAELLMPQALGEFGKSRNSDVANSILNIIRNNSPEVTTPEELYKHVSQDIESNQQLMDIIYKLVNAKKIQGTRTKDKAGFLPVRRGMEETSEYVDFSLLTNEEREMKI